MKDINVVLRDKRVQLSELALEINGLEAAVTALRPVAHLRREPLTRRHGCPPHPSRGSITCSSGRAARRYPRTLPSAPLGVNPVPGRTHYFSICGMR